MNENKLAEQKDMRVVSYPTKRLRGLILEAIATHALAPTEIAALVKAHRSTINRQLLALEATHRVRKSHKVGGRTCWIAADAPPVAIAPTVTRVYPAHRAPVIKDLDSWMRREADKKLAEIKPFRDWTAAWIPNKQAA